MTSKEEMLKIVSAQEIAYNNKDLDSFCKCFHNEVTVLRLTSNEGFSGIDTFKSKSKVLFENNPNLHCLIKSRIVLASSVIDEEFITGITNQPDLSAVAIYGFRDGLIDRVWFAR